MVGVSDQLAGGTDRIIVRCPECSEEFETHDIGDLVACEKCDNHFQRFTNIVGEASD